MNARKIRDVILLLLALEGAVAALAGLGVAALHRTPLDTVAGGRGPFHGFGGFLAIPIVLGALASVLLMARRRRSL